MKPKNILSLALLGLLVLPLAAAKDVAIASKWAVAPVQVDGQGDEWTPEEMVAIGAVGAKIAVRNDARNIYVLLNLEDPKYHSSIQQTGVTFWVNPDMKSKKVHGIRLAPKSITADELIKELEGQGQALTEERKAEIRKQKEYLLYACETVDKKGKVVPHDPKAGVGTYRMVQVQKSRVLEFVVPMALFNNAENEVAVDLSKPFKLGVEWGGMTEEMKAIRAAQMGDRMAAASDSRVGGDSWNTEGQAVGERSGGGGSLSMMRGGPKVYSFWVDLTVASENK
ncbi:MAG: hypothetical protein JW843_08485 [Candidatus Aminicenantes bacterium]|nr:hypothetical protein [Candidatus Aminicenantes bacterium]